MAPVPVFAQSAGSPSLAGSVVAQASPALGVWALDVQILNNGSGAAQNIALNTLQLRTVSGSGTVTYDTSLSPALPLAVGGLAPGASAVVRLYFDAPATVQRFSVTENGTLRDTSGTNLNFSLSQALISIAALTSVQPNSGQQGQQNLQVTIAGKFSHFTQGMTTADLGAGVTVQSLAVNSLTNATAVLNIDPAATLGARTVTLTTGAESLKLNNGFTVTAGTPMLTNVNPNTGQQGQQSESVSLTGQFTHWVQGTTTANFGAGITVASLIVNSANSATAVLNIDPAAAVGPRNVSLTTAAEVVALNNGFTVTAGTPLLTTVNPNTGQQGQQSESVSLTGRFTHWVQGTTAASFGAGITVSSLTVNSATSATAVLNIDPAAAAGARNVSLTTAAEVVTLNNGFTVTAGTPLLTTVNPNTGQQGQQSESVSLTGQFTHWVQGTTTANFGAGITVSSLTVNSATSATAVLNIDPAAAAGARNVSVTTATEVVALNNAFTVTDGTPMLTTVNPNTGQQGQQSESVSLTGQFTHWVQGTTTASFGAGITVASLTVNSLTNAAAVLNIDAAATLGPRDVSLTTGAEAVTLSNGFAVTGHNSISFTIQPGTTRLGQHLSPAVQVTLLDANGQVLTTASGPVTISLKASAQAAVLTGTLTQNAVNGVATFADLSVNRTGKADTLIASSGSLSTTSAPFDVVLSPAQVGACVPAGSQSLLIQGANVSAYLPNGAWGIPNKNVQLVPIEGAGTRATIETQNPVNSCASNSETGQTVCTANNTDVYVIQGSTLTDTLTSGSNAGVGSPFLSGGSCLNCNVAMNTATNQAVIGMGLNPGAAGIQILDLTTKQFAPPISSNGLGISEGTLVDPNLNLVLSASETNHFALFDLSSKRVFDYNISGFLSGAEADSTSEDCTTGIALAAEEDSSPTQIFLTDLTQATFDTASSTWTAPAQSQPFPEFLNITTAEGIAIASSAHLGLVIGEFGYTGFGVIQLPSTSGSGIPAVQDYVAVRMPADPSGDPFRIEGDPHMAAAYMSPNDGKAYGVVPNSLASTVDRYVAIIDLQGILNARRSDAHTLASDVDLVATGLVRFVAVESSPAQMSFVSQPVGAVAGQASRVQVAIENAQGQVDNNNAFAVTLSVGGTRLGSVQPVNGIATFLVEIDQAGTYTLTASTSQLGAITSNPFTVAAAAASKLSFVTQPSNIVAGQALPTIQVGWQDQFGNPAPSVLPIALALNTNTVGATLSGNTQVTPVNGVASFPGLTVQRTGPFSMLASGTSASGNTVQAQSAFFQVTSGGSARLVFVTQPSTAAAGQIMNNIQVAVQDALGNTVTNATNPVSLALGVNPTGATLSPSGSTSTNASGGVATFFGLTVNFAGVGYTMVASSPGLPMATSAPFNISGAGPTVSLAPSSMRQGETVSVTITATGTHFQQGVTVASFGPGVMVGGAFSGAYGPVNVTSPTTAVAQLSAAAAAAPGFRTVALQTGLEQDTYTDAFEVRGVPSLSSIFPLSGNPGQALSVTLNGIYTNFVQGTTQANFGPGISVGGATSGGFGPVTVTAPGTAVAQITISSAAAVGLRTPITVLTGAEQATLADGGFLVMGTVTGPPPVPSITGLTEGMEITAPTTVTGTIASPNLSNWTLDYAPNGSSSFTALATGTTPAVTGTLDPTLLLNGMNTVRLTAVDQSGQTTSTTVDVVVARKLKVGNFSLSFLDLSLPVAGIPIQIMRTYDSRDKTKGDFGIGWSLAIKSVHVDVNGKLGNNWIGTSTGGVIPTYCVQSSQAHLVTARLQDGTVYQFQAVPTADTQCNAVLPPAMVDLTFVPFGSTPSSVQLFQPNSSSLIVSGQFGGPLQLLDFNTLGVFGEAGDADQWILTMPDGQSVQVSVTFGVQSITDRNGNTLTVGPNGITSSLGPAVTFGRDAQNRITSIRDPNLNLIQYQYSAAGDLSKVVDQRQNISSFTYDDNHYLISFTDPTGAQPVRNAYDDAGRLIQQIDALGHVQNFGHDLAARTDSITDYLGNVTTYAYDNHGNIIQETDALGNVTSKTFDANDNVLTETNALGKTTSYSYDANNNRLSITDPLGNTTRFTYNELNQPLSTTDPNGATTRNAYDPSGRVLTRTGPLGNTITNEYTNSGALAAITDADGYQTQYTYNSAGGLTGVADALGTVTTYTYDENRNRTSESIVRTTSSGQQTLLTKYQYDARNQLIKVTYPDGSTSQNALDANGRLSVRTDQLGRQTSYTYDAAGRLLSQVFPDGTRASSTYDAGGNRVASTDRSGATTTYTFDALHRPLATTNALGTVVSTAYDAAGQVISTTDVRGNVTRFSYDAAGRQTSRTNALGEVTEATFDADGQQTAVKDAAGRVTTVQYDAGGRQTKIIYADGTAGTVAYDARGNVVARTDPAGNTTQFGYDGLKRLVSVTDALGHTSGYTYDEVGDRVSVSDANGHVTQFQFDQQGRQSRRTLPGGQSETFSYDAAGQLSSHTDFNGNTTVYSYDSAGRMLSKTPDPKFHAPPVNYTYTVSGQRASMTDASGSTAYTYDVLGRLTAKQSPEGSITYDYETAGNLTGMQAGALGLTYAYDLLNRLTSVTEPTSGTTTYSYDAAGNLASVTDPNSVTNTYSYNTKNQLTNLAAKKGGSPVAAYDYTLDAVGHRLSVAELGGRVVNYAYDNVYRLTSETVTATGAGPSGTVTYSLDPVGNRAQISSTVPGIVSGSFSYDVDDRINTDTYDANGNTIASGGINDVYDFENHLIQHGGVTIVYDGDGNRVSETAGGITTKYLIDDHNFTGFPQLVAETSSDGSTRTFVYGLQRISQRQVIPASNTDLTSFYIYDGHGSVRALADASGATTDTYDYDAFGNLINRTGTTPNNFLFAGEEFDPALGVYYNRARYYDERGGRFWSMDTFEGSSSDPKSLHKYLYTDADPVNGRDPSGNFDAIEIGTVLAVDAVLVGVAFGFFSGGILGCAKGALTPGGSCSGGAAAGAAYGGALGAAGPFLTIPGRILIGLASSWMAGKEAHDACEQEQWALCALDALVAVGTVFTTGRSINEGPLPPTEATIGHSGGAPGAPPPEFASVLKTLNATGCTNKCAAFASLFDSYLASGGTLDINGEPIPALIATRQGFDAQYAGVPKSYNSTPEEIEAIASSGGTQWRGIVTAWKSYFVDGQWVEKGHAVNVVNWQGQVYFIDPQAGGLIDLSTYDEFLTYWTAAAP